MNIVLIVTDTQNKRMVGAYGQTQMDTPNLDRLAAQGMRFERAYPVCPLCVPARGTIFSGLYPQLNGVWCNNVAPARNVPLMGEIFRNLGYRAGHTGKWHLDGTGYFGDGRPDGGFEPDWWYDGKNYADDLGPEMFKAYKSAKTADDLRRAGFTETNCWGHRVADRAVDFLERAGEDPFVLSVCFDEPHSPYVAPPEYWEKFETIGLPATANYCRPPQDKPKLAEVHHEALRQQGRVPDESGAMVYNPRFFGCNSYIDREIGRVVDAVDRLHADDTVIIYTSDHGDQMLSHGLIGKGPMMYEESCNVPLIVRGPGVPEGAVSHALFSQLDLMPTMLDLAGLERPDTLNGVSQAPTLRDPSHASREHAMLVFHRFAINHDSRGEFYPIRCVTDGRYKLIVNLFESDELYDLETDPDELHNRIEDSACESVRDALHDRMLEEMDATRDPFRSFRWGDRPWRKARSAFWIGKNRPRPSGFSFRE